MPEVEELFGKQMSWPRLIIKFGVEVLLAYNAYNYMTDYKPDWDCWASGKRQPSGVETEGARNVTEEFTTVISFMFYGSLVGALVSFLEICNKKAKNKQLTVFIGIADTIIGLAAFAWLIWASFVRLGRDGKICAGATTNVSVQVKPYAYAQGAFLQVMLVLMYVIPPSLFVATNCGCL